SIGTLDDRGRRDAAGLAGSGSHLAGAVKWATHRAGWGSACVELPGPKSPGERDRGCFARRVLRRWLSRDGANDDDDACCGVASHHTALRVRTTIANPHVGAMGVADR